MRLTKDITGTTGMECTYGLRKFLLLFLLNVIFVITSNLSNIVHVRLTEPENVNNNITYSRNQLLRIGNSGSNVLSSVTLTKCRRLGLKKKRINKRGSRSGFKLRSQKERQCDNHNNITYVKLLKGDRLTKELGKHHIEACLINVRSLKSKVTELVDYVHKRSCDIVIITESWLKEEDDPVWLEQNSLTDIGYKLFSSPRRDNRKGGGVAVAVTSHITITKGTEEDRLHWQ